MSHNDPTRYDKLREKIDRDFTRSTTLAPALAAGERKTLVNIDDHTGPYAITERFQKFAPFNAVYVRNLSSYDIRLYLNTSRESYVTVPAATNQAVPVIDNMPNRYYRFLEVENLNGSNAISAGDVEIQIGNELDSVELSLLRDAGLLDV